MQSVQNFFLGLATFLISLLGLQTQPSTPPTSTPPGSEFRALLELDAQAQAKLNDLIVEMDGQVNYTVSSRTGKVVLLAGLDRSIPVHETEPRGIAVELIARRFLNEYGELFGIKNQEEELELIRIDGSVFPLDVADGPRTVKFGYFDPTRMSHVRFQQVYQGVPVFGSQIIVHIKADGGIASVNGHVLPDISLTPIPSLSAEASVNIAKDRWLKQFSVDPKHLFKPELYIVDPSWIIIRPPQKVLVWRVEVLGKTPDGPKREFFFLNANTGEIVVQTSGLYTALDRQIYDCQGEDICSSWPDSPNRTENMGATGNTKVDTLYQMLNNVHDYFSKFGRCGANGQCGTGDGASHFFVTDPREESEINTGLALWSKTYGFVNVDIKDNAFTTGWEVAVGDSSKGTIDLLTKDVIAHEYTHIVTANTAGLEYSYQSGALNEAISDVFAADEDWQLKVKKDGQLVVLRSLSQPEMTEVPEAKPQPDRLYSPRYACDAVPFLSYDYGWIHINSGVINKTAYLIAEGTEREPSGEFNGCSFTGIGRDKMEKIFYRALTTRFTPTSNFGDAYWDLILACSDLFGYESYECSIVKIAGEATEIAQQPHGLQQARGCPKICIGSWCTGSEAEPPRAPKCALLTPTPSPLVTPTPSISACEEAGGVCVVSENLCLANGGTVDPQGPRGCSNVCCLGLETATPTPTFAAPLELSIYLIDKDGTDRGAGGTYLVGEQVNICWIVPEPGNITVSTRTADGSRTLFTGINERSGCVAGEISPPTGRHDYTIDYQFTERQTANTYINVTTFTVTPVPPSCDDIGGVCTTVDVCQANNGELKGKRDCPDTCCVFPGPPVLTATPTCRVNGSDCGFDTDCCSGFCDLSGGVPGTCLPPVASPTPVPTLTPCEQEGGTCVISEDLCLDNNGTVKGKLGCANVCCQF